MQTTKCHTTPSASTITWFLYYVITSVLITFLLVKSEDTYRFKCTQKCYSRNEINSPCPPDLISCAHTYPIISSDGIVDNDPEAELGELDYFQPVGLLAIRQCALSPCSSCLHNITKDTPGCTTDLWPRQYLSRNGCPTPDARSIDPVQSIIDKKQAPRGLRFPLQSFENSS